MAALRRIFSRRLLPLGLLFLLAAEFLLFDQLGAHHHTWVYPRWNDQIQYLTESYLGHEDAKAHGLLTALGHALVNPSAQGTLHDFGAILMFSVAGPSRSAALSLNMLAFLAWQAAFFLWIFRSTRSHGLAFAGAALLLVLKSPWAVAPGSAFDFRLDWLTASALGLTLLAVYAADRFRSSIGALLFGLAVALTLLTRFLTGTYFVLIFAALAVWAALPPDRWGRLARLALSAAVAAAVAGPIFWINRATVYNYYLIGHFVGPESALRSSHMGLGRSAWWVLSRFATEHLGLGFLLLVLAVLVAGLLAAVVSPVRPQDPGFDPAPKLPSFFPAFAFALAPAVVLTLHVQKTEQVLGAMLAGGATLLILPGLRALGACRPTVRAIIAGATVAVALGGFAAAMIRNPHSPAMEEAARNVNAALDYVVKRSDEAGLTSPKIAVDRITDSLDAQIMRVLAYERYHRWIPFLMTLPTGIHEEKPEVYWERLRESDFVFLTADGDPGFWPYDRQLTGLRAETHHWADEHLKRVRDFQLTGFRMDLYERRDLP